MADADVVEGLGRAHPPPHQPHRRRLALPRLRGHRLLLGVQNPL